MIYLEKGAENVVNLCIKDINLPENYQYTFKLTNLQSLDEWIFYSPDNANSPFWASFTISCFTYSGLTQGIIDAPIGYYNLEIHEMDQISLDLDNSIRIVKEDNVYIWGTYSEIPENKIIDEYKINVII